MPHDLANQVLIKLADNKDTAGGVARALSLNYNKLPQDLVNQLLQELRDVKGTATGEEEVSCFVFQKYDKLPQDMWKIILACTNLEFMSWHPEFVLYSGINLYGILNDKKIQQKLLQHLADKGKADSEYAYEVAYAIFQNYDKLPQDLANQALIKLADNEYAAAGLAYALSFDYDNIPPDVANQLVLELSKKGLI